MKLFSVMLNICARVVTLILLFIAILRKLFTPDGTLLLSLQDIWGILFIGLVSGVAFGLFYLKKNMSGREVLLTHCAYFLIVNATLSLTGFHLGWFKKELPSIVLMEAMFTVIYILVTLLVYLLDFNEAKKINEKLQARKRRQGE